MKYLIIIARGLLGLVFAVFGSNAFLHFIPIPEMHGDPGAFMGALFRSGYIYPIALLQVLGGLCLLIGTRFVPLGLTPRAGYREHRALSRFPRSERHADSDCHFASRALSSLDLPLQVSRNLPAVAAVYRIGASAACGIPHATDATANSR